MSTLNRLLTMVLRGKRDQFNTVLQEELKQRASLILERLYKTEAENALKCPAVKQTIPENAVKLSENDQIAISKLYESLNTGNKERMLKLMSESQESVNRVLHLARLKLLKEQR